MLSSPHDRGTVTGWMIEGGYPELVNAPLSAARSSRWFDADIVDVVAREALRPIADVRYELELRRLLAALAARIGGDLDRATVTNYVTLLEALYLIYLVPAFATSATTAAKRRPVIQLTDTGLAAHLLRMTATDLRPTSTHRMAGKLIEAFAVIELLKQTRGGPIRST